MFGLIAGTAIGIGLGTITGIVPGIHTNTVAGTLLSSEAFLLPVLGTETLAAMLFATLIAHTFLDSVPSTFLGVPDPDTAVAVLPLHELCLEGRGEEAVRLSALGSAFGLVAGVPVALCALVLLPPVQPFLDFGTALILIFIMGLFIILSSSPGWCFATFLLSGAVGVFAMRYSYLSGFFGGTPDILLPLLTGLFGIPVLMSSKNGVFPEQHRKVPDPERKNLVFGTLAGTVTGCIVGWLPGLSNAVANGLLTPVLLKKSRKRKREGFIIASAAANTCNAMTGVAALLALSRTRNGVMSALSTLEVPPVHVILAAGALAGCAAYLITLAVSHRAGALSGLDSRILNRAVMAGIIILCAVLTGPFGLFVLVLATLAGMLPDICEVPRVACIGAVTLPVILFTLDIAIV